MSVISSGSKKMKGSKSGTRRSTSSSLSSKKSQYQYSASFTSEHGSKFGRSVSKFPKQNDPSLMQSVSVVNSRVIRTLTNFPVNYNAKIPDLTNSEATDCIRELGHFMNISDYQFNYASFWLLDVLSKLIKGMQQKGFSTINQNLCLSWFRFVLRSISISGDSRENTFRLLEKMFLKAEESVKSDGTIPQPEEILILEKRSSRISSGDIRSRLSSKSLQRIHSSKQSQRRGSQKSVKSSRKSSVISRLSKRSHSAKSWNSKTKTSLEEKVETNLQTLCSIVEMIYSVFADRFMYSLISEVYSSPTIVTPEEIPIDFKDPKQLRPILVLTPPPSPSSRKPSPSRKKGKDKGKKARKVSPASADIPGTVDKGKKSKKSKDNGGKAKKKSKSIGDARSSQGLGANSTVKQSMKSTTSEDLRKIQKQQLEEKIKLFDRPPAPEMKLGMKKIEVKDKFILPLTEGVREGYVENLIKSLLPPETKPVENVDASRSNNEKTRKSSVGKKKKNSKANKKAKGKK